MLEDFALEPIEAQVVGLDGAALAVLEAFAFEPIEAGVVSSVISPTPE